MTVRKTAMPVLVLTLLSMPVFGDDIFCQSGYEGETVDGNLVIAAPCRLNGTKVDGNVTIFAGGSLTAIGAIIEGDIEADTADFLDLRNSEVNGDVELEDMVGDVSYVRNTTIDGKLVAKKSRSRFEFHNNYIDDELKVEKNSGDIIITQNIIDGDLKCKNNTPAPVGGNNQVSGKQEGQCTDLEAEKPSGEPEDDEPTGTTGQPDEPTGTTGQPDATTGTPVDADPTPLELNTGTGGGASLGPLLIVFLLTGCVFRSRRLAALASRR